MDQSQAIVSRVAGVILLVFGFALAALLIVILLRNAARPGGLGVVVAGVTAISAFCLLLGYRLALNRPNRHESLLSPTSWKVLAASFVVLAVVMGSSVMRDGAYTVIPAAAAALLGYGCILASRGVRVEPPPSQVFPPETSLLQVGGFTPAGLRYGIEILNDERTPMEFVVSVLQKNLGLSEPEAIRTMLEIHSKGGVLVVRESFEESRRIAEAVTAEARVADHPLTCRAVSVEHGPLSGP
jgi:ATP-dependent Clp protease adapter protein ClpS